MSTPPPPPPRRARGPVDPTPQGDDASAPPPPPPRRTEATTAAAAPVSTTAVAPTPAGPTRAERRATAPNGGGSNGGRGRRRGLVIGAVVVVVLLVAGGAFAAGVFSGSGSGDSGPPEASTNVKLEAGDVEVRWPGLGPGQAAPDLQDQVLAVIGRYVDEGIVAGLRTGSVDPAALSDTFDQSALAQLDDANARSSLLDEKLPKAIGKLTILAPPIEIIALNDADNKTVLAAAKVDLDVRVQSNKGFYRVKHEGQLVFAPEANGDWKVTGWHVKAVRTPPTPRAPWITTTTAEKTTST